MKNKDIPSMPNVKFRVNMGNQGSLQTNWKKPEDLLKLPHKSKDPMKEKKAVFKPIHFNNRVSREGTDSNKKIPIIGNINM